MAFKARINEALHEVLKDIYGSYTYIKGLVGKTKEKAPYVYDEIERLVRDHLVSFESKESILQRPDLNGFGKVVAQHIANKLPHLSQDQITTLIRDTSKTSFLDMLTVGLDQQSEFRDLTKVSQRKLFKRVLIANRGEIALRILRACRELHIETVAVYTKPDAQSLAVKFADKAYLIGPNTDAYLDYHRIVAIAKKAKADAIHPGYGFLSENSSFAKLCEQSKIKFIGPSAKSMDIMGNKDQARHRIEKLHIPLIEGTPAIADEEQALREARRIGFPVMIKAVAGGGGKGMRICRKEENFLRRFQSAKAEAQLSFNNDAMYLENYLEEPHHIEFQILADRRGHAIHLGERDCSIQRKHQKLIEETPSPAITDELRNKMGEAAIAIVKSVKYEGAGTVEFLLDKEKNFYFIEMNTRIQVEHGITELVTGVDLIKEQIKIAAGGKLTYKQKDITFDGWAIECRINAESPSRGFTPQTGTITNYLPPGGPGIRICSSCHSGHVVSPHYDSLIAKLMCKGKNRQEAIARMLRALHEYIIEGVDTTIPLHIAVLKNKEFLRGEVTTNFLRKNKILEKLEVKPEKRKGLSKDEKILIVSTAVSHYLKGRRMPSSRRWAAAHRQEIISHGEL